jgi:hypothetical protein
MSDNKGTEIKISWLGCLGAVFTICLTVLVVIGSYRIAVELLP